MKRFNSLLAGAFLCISGVVAHAVTPIVDGQMTGSANQLKSGATLTIKAGATLDIEGGASFTGVQPLSTNLTAFAALTGAADKLPYFTGSGTLGLADFSTFTRGLTPLSGRTAWFDAIAPSSPSDGDLLVYDAGTSHWVKLARGTDRQLLASTSTTWAPTDTIAVVSIAVGGGTAMTKVLTASAAIDWPSISANSENTQTLTVTGALTTDTPTVELGWGAALETGIVVKQAWVSGADTVSIRVANVTGGSIDPASITVRAKVTKF